MKSLTYIFSKKMKTYKEDMCLKNYVSKIDLSILHYHTKALIVS